MLARRVSHLEPSSTLAITAKAKQLKAQGVDIVNLAAGEPDFDTPDHVKAAGIQAIQQGKTKYTPTTGIEELKQAIVRKLKEENHLDYAPAQVVVSCGAKHALFNAIQVLCDEGDEVLICSPYWVSYPEMVKVSLAQPVFVQTQMRAGFRPSPEAFTQALTPRTRLLILNSPSNPTGAVLTRDDLFWIAELAVQRKLWVISDEIYEHLIYDGLKHTSITTINRELSNQTLVVNGVSKTFAMTGWRIGYLAGPREVVEAVSRLQDHTTSNPTSISQYAAVAALNAMESRDWVVRMREEFARRRDRMVEGLARIPQVKFWKPQGAFYVLCHIGSVGMAPAQVAARLLDEARVAVIPGEGFGAPDAIRLSFATSLEEIDRGIERLGAWISQVK